MERMQFAQSAIGEADVPAVVSRLTQSQILSQTAVSMAAEANTNVERILNLLQG